MMTSDDIKRELVLCSFKLKNSKFLIKLSIVIELIFGILFYLFVYHLGNTFDMILSSLFYFCFLNVFIYNLRKYNKLKKDKKTLEKEYMISIETPDEKLQRTRQEKFKRILK